MVTKIIIILCNLMWIFSCVSTSTYYISPSEMTEYKTGREVTLGLIDGTEVTLLQYEVRNDTLMGLVFGQGNKAIHYSSVTSVRIQKEDYTSLYYLGACAPVALWLIIGALSAPEPPPSECCPFVYSYDGNAYVFDAEPYGAAICKGLQRTEWCLLEHLAETKNHYRILVTNELNETQYLDELHLITIDHPPEVKVYSDGAGAFHTVSVPVAPLSAYSNDVPDILPLISKSDELFWHSAEIIPASEDSIDLREELIFEFDRPRHNTEVKLIINANTTLWGSSFAKQILNLYGDQLPSWYEEVNNRGPAFYRAMQWFYEEELYLLKVHVWTNEGWKSRATLHSGGPYISEEKIYILDISDIPGDRLKIKLMPPRFFWNINYLAVDFSDDAEITAQELQPVSIKSENAKSIVHVVNANDNNYHVMSEIGDSMELMFEAPDRSEKFHRSTFIKASGYYDVRCNPQGAANMEMLERIQSIPGYTLRYAYEQYLEWRKQNNHLAGLLKK